MKARVGSDRAASRPAAIARDTEATAFTGLLADLIARVPGARAAALVDGDGETVDYAGTLSPFDVKVAAAHLQLVLADVRRLRQLGLPRQLVVRGAKRSFLVRALPDAYALAILLARRAGFTPSSRAFAVFERELQREAGIGSASAQVPPWTPLLVEEDARARPARVASVAKSARHAVEVLGTVVGLGRGERGFRVRLPSGFETTVVREPGGVWYAEEPLDQS